ncbi:MAG: hypothetical protein FWE91_08620 [Defluviitaleaceae bacterium]|nr:hypothetical protein [Defluviitaleaceae bacterium]MCL2835248.1 hypothetical protein [Defluviitaleaceae bacterium]
MAELGRIKGLLERRNELCTELLELTRSAVFGGKPEDSETDAVIFTELYDNREPVLAELDGVHEEIGQDGYALARSSGDGAVSKLLAESEELLTQLMELDKRNIELGRVMHKDMRENIRRINQGRNISLKYGAHGETDGYLVDNKN